MPKYLVKNTSINGDITIPGSKSHTLRSILFASLADGNSTIRHYLASTDTDAMIDACRLLGAKIEVTPTLIQIQGTNGTISHAEDVINAGNSGIVLRFCAAIGALSSHPLVITGDHSIRHQRPMQPLIDGLAQLGVSAVSMRGDGYAPIIIHGPIKSGKTIVSGEDSQPISALLIASAFAEGPTHIEVRNAGEKPWIALTLDWFDRLGISYKNENFEEYYVPGKSRYKGFDYTVPGDLSSAAFPIAAALVTGSEITVHNMDMQDSQGDKELIFTLQKMGANIIIDEQRKVLHVKKGKTLSGITVDINNFIDAITILAVVACYAEGETWIQNGAIAKHKECNRIHCITTELRKMGANIVETEDGLRIQGSTLNGNKLNSHNDHRMVMSLAVAAMGAEGESTISDVECVSKTFSSFVQDFKLLGANIEVF
jgi:3-phosphoshikimate 1-carboxyvinyltransferase